MPPNAKVSELIDQDNAVWKTDVVQQMFLPHEASEILGIPLSEMLPPDQIIWACTPPGMFTTSSAYKLIISCDSSSSAGSSNPKAQRQFWKGIWHLRTPNKIKHFIWKARNNALPTMANLYHRHIVTTEICEGCQDRTEDTLHALWFCQEIVCVCGIQWSGSTKTYQSSPCHSATFFPGSCILGTNSDWSSSQSWHGCFGIGVMLGTLVSQFIHSPRFVVWLVLSSKNSLQFSPSPQHPLVQSLCSNGDPMNIISIR